MKNTKYVLLAKHAVYTALFLLFYVVQSVPGFLEFRGTKPIWVLPAAVAVAMLEGEFVGGIYGAFAGLLCDMGSFLLFGFNGFLTCLYCIATGLLVIYLMRCNLLGCILFTLFFMALRGSLEFLFEFGMWGFERVGWIYLARTLPTAVFSTALCPIVFFLFRGLHNKFETHLSGM